MPTRSCDIVGCQLNGKGTCMEHLLCKFPNPIFEVQFPKKWTKQKKVAFTRMWYEGRVDPEIKITYTKAKDGAAIQAELTNYEMYEN